MTFFGFLSDVLLKKPPSSCRISSGVVSLRASRLAQTPEWGKIEDLAWKALDEAPRNPLRAEQLSRQAGLLACRFAKARPHAVSEAVACQLGAFTMAVYANACRVSSRLFVAREAFLVAAHFWRYGRQAEDEAGYLPRIFELEASLFRDIRAFSEALEMISGAIELHRRHHNGEGILRSSLNKATILAELNRPGEALETLTPYLDSPDAEKYPALARSHLGIMVDCLSRQGRFKEAARLFPRLRAAYSGIAGPMEKLRIQWIESRIEAGNGQSDRACFLLEGVRRAFARKGHAYDAALASLELAALYLEQGRAQEVRALVSQMLPLFREQEIHREALAALALFQNAISKEQANRDMAYETLSFLREAHSRPDLKFRSPASPLTEP